MVKKIFLKRLKNSFKKLAFLKKCSAYPPLKYSHQDVKVSLLKKVLYLPPLKNIYEYFKYPRITPNKKIDVQYPIIMN